MDNKVYIKWGVIGVFAVTLFLIVIFLCVKLQGYNINIKDENIMFAVKQKGLKGATSFEFDEMGNTYIAFKDKILKVDNKGKSDYILNNLKYDITSLTYGNNSLYFFSKNTLYSIDVEGAKTKKILSKIPTGNGRNIIKYNNDKIFISIPSSTNSGIAEKGETADITPFEVISNGVNFGEEKTGVFMPYGVSLKDGEKIKGANIGNASIIAYDLNKKTYNTMAYGIKSVGGFDFNEDNEIFATVNGMENIGVRPVTNDSDYIYKVEEGFWYGWPDYSGGDPINSPRFTDENGKVNDFIIKNHQVSIGKAPLYMHKNISALTSIAVDTKGYIGKKDLMYFFDNKVKKLYYVNEKGIYKDYGEFGINAEINEMKFFSGKLYVLDSNSGYLSFIEEKDMNSIKLNREMFILVIISSISFVVLIRNIGHKLNNKK